MLVFLFVLFLGSATPVLAASDSPPPTAGRVWGDAIAQRWIPVILSGIALAGLNQHYWRLRYRKQVAGVRLHKMIETYEKVSADLAGLINRLNQLIEAKERKRSHKAKAETAIVEEELVKGAADLSIEFSDVRLYFEGRAGGAAAAIMAMVQGVSADINGDEKVGYIKVGHPLYEAAMNLQEELRQSLRHALKNND